VRKADDGCIAVATLRHTFTKPICLGWIREAHERTLWCREQRLLPGTLQASPSPSQHRRQPSAVQSTHAFGCGSWTGESPAMRESWGKGYGVSSELEDALNGDGGVYLPCVHKHGSHAARSMHLWISQTGREPCLVRSEPCLVRRLNKRKLEL
jgi:hypothetical protein